MLYQKLWFRDIDTVLSVLPELVQLDKHSVLVTGASGLIGSAVVDILIRFNETHKGTIQIIAAGRSAEKMQRRFSLFFQKDYFHFAQYDALDTNIIIDEKADYIIHGAGNAYPALFSREPVETMVSNFTGTLKLLDFAKEHNTKRFLFISSSEVYGLKENNFPFKENEYGYINLLDSRNAYSTGKRAAETLCASYSDEYGMETLIVRPGHIYGPTASRDDNRVSSAWAFQAAENKDIVMKSDGTQIRSYCYCLDCASAILKVLLKGEKTKAYNISNPNAIIDIKGIAEIMAQEGNVKLIKEIPTDIEQKSFNPMDNSSLDSSSLEGLGWIGFFDPKTGFSHTIQIIRDSQEKK